MTFKERAIKCARAFGKNLGWGLLILGGLAVAFGGMLALSLFILWLQEKIGYGWALAALGGTGLVAFCAVKTFFDCRRD